MPFSGKSSTYAGVGVGATGAGSILSLLAFVLPYWVYYDEDMTITDATGSYQVQLQYNYGFWRYCNKVTSAISNSDRCGSVATHSDYEQTTLTLLMMALNLFLSAIVNGFLYLTKLKKQKLCLYISWISVVAAGILVLVSIIIFAGTDHSVTVTNSLVLNFSASNLHASFWLAVTGFVVAAVATVFITLALIAVHRIEKNKLEDAKSILSYNSARTSSDKHYEENDDEIPKEYTYKDPAIPEEYSYMEATYSTSPENSLSTSESYDSDDSDMDPAFAKLKTQISTKPSEVNGSMFEVPEIRRCRSSQPITGIRLNDKLKRKSVSAGILTSRSATELTPVEQPDIFSEFVSERSTSRSEKKLTVHVDPFHHPFYFDKGGHLEASKAPIATNFTFTIPRHIADAGDELILTRSKTYMPLTQRMMKSIGIKRKDPLQNLQDSLVVPIREPAEIFPEITQAEIIPEMAPAARTKSFPKKPHKSKSKHRKPSNKELQRNKELNAVYRTLPPIKTFYPGQMSGKPAPWSKARAKLGMRPKTPKTLKSSLMAYGVDSIPKFPNLSISPKKKLNSQHPDEDIEAQQSITLVGDIDSVGDSSYA